MKIKLILNNLYDAILSWIKDLGLGKKELMQDLNAFYGINQTLVPLLKAEKVDPKEIFPIYETLINTKLTSKNDSTITLIDQHLSALIPHVSLLFKPIHPTSPTRSDSEKTVGYDSDEEKKARARSTSTSKKIIKRPVLEPSADPEPDSALAAPTLKRTLAMAAINPQGLI